jgi:hypothetical protein
MMAGDEDLLLVTGQHAAPLAQRVLRRDRLGGLINEYAQIA